MREPYLALPRFVAQGYFFAARLVAGFLAFRPSSRNLARTVASEYWRNIAISLTLSPASIAPFKCRVVMSDHGLPSGSASFKGVAFGSYDSDVAGSKYLW